MIEGTKYPTAPYQAVKINATNINHNGKLSREIWNVNEMRNVCCCELCGRLFKEETAERVKSTSFRIRSWKCSFVDHVDAWNIHLAIAGWSILRIVLYCVLFCVYVSWLQIFKHINRHHIQYRPFHWEVSFLSAFFIFFLSYLFYSWVITCVYAFDRIRISAHLCKHSNFFGWRAQCVFSHTKTPTKYSFTSIVYRHRKTRWNRNWIVFSLRCSLVKMIVCVSP